MGAATAADGPNARPETALTRRWAASLCAAFAAVHAGAFWAGLRFDTTSLGVFMHFIDPELLRDRLLESCFYLHIQPPLFNLFLGMGLKLGAAAGIVFHVVYLAFGFVLYLTVFVLQRRLGVSPRLAFVSSTLFMLSPPFLLTEHWLFYTFPCAMLLALAALALHAVLRRESAASWGLFFGILFLLAGMRTVFHLVYVVFVLGAAAVALPGCRRRVLAGAVLPLLLVFAMYAKNYAVFGEFTLCTWSGKHLWIKTIGNLTWEQRQALVASGRISEVSLINRFAPSGVYPERYQRVEGFEDVPALRQLYKSSGEFNYNHLTQIAISKQYGRDGLQGLKSHPRTFAMTTLQAWAIYFMSNSRWMHETENYARLRPLVEVYDRLIYGRLPVNLFRSFPPLARMASSQYAVLIVGLPLVLLHGIWFALRGRGLSFERRALLLFLCFNIVYVAVLGNLMEILETNRFRFTTDPLSVVLAGVLVQRAAAAWAARRDRRAAATD